jgi:putative SbcD/Mre11-related phosphoesterase
MPSGPRSRPVSPFPDCRFHGRAALIESAGTLLVADLHVGRVRRSRVDLPVGESADLSERLQKRLAETEPERVVVAGDLIHAFDALPYGVSETVGTLRETIQDAEAEFVVTGGNHDGLLDRVDGVEPLSSIRIDDRTLVHHGHERPTASAERYVIGHEHPAIEIEGDRRPCFLVGPDQYDGAAVLVLPAFSRVAVGTTVNGTAGADAMSPLLTDLDRCRPVVPTADGPLTFPPLGELRPHL